ncbi:MAG: PA2778 family cysteine peptidase [Thiotrichales bacterium]
MFHSGANAFIRQVRRIIPLVALLTLAVALTSCATPPQTRALIEAAPPSLPPRALLEQVPFLSQDRDQCGPAALAMALGSSGHSITPDALREQVFLPARGGSLQPEMLATARRHGRLALVLPPRLDAVLQTVAAGWPVIVLQNLSLPVFPRWHYAVVVGYHLAADAIVLHSGRNERLRLPLAVFEYTWGRSRHWAMIASAPDQLPAHIDATTLLRAAVALEPVDAAAARLAYAALVQRDATLYPAWMGLGNTAHAAADPKAAADAFRAASQLRPDHADAWNNLARALHATGQFDEGHRAALRAVELGGARSELYRQTLRLFAPEVR